FHVTAVGQSTMQADVYFTDNSNSITHIAFDRGPAVSLGSGVAGGPLGVQAKNSGNAAETITGNNTVTIQFTSSSGTGRFDSSLGGTFTQTSLTQTVHTPPRTC